MNQESFRDQEKHFDHGSLDQLFLERFITEVDRLKTQLNTNTETLYRLSRDVNDLREAVEAIKEDIEKPVQAYDYGVFAVSVINFIKPLLFAAIGAAAAWFTTKR